MFSTDKPVEQCLGTLRRRSFLATLYSYLGIPLETHFPDRFGRPMAFFLMDDPSTN